MTLTAARMATFLADNVSAIAAAEDAGMCFAEIRRCIDEIERCINRPVPPRYLGPCPTLIGHHQECATQLTTRDRQAEEIQCPSCKSTHRVDYLLELMRNDLAYHAFTAVELLGSRGSEMPGVLVELGESVARTTFKRWIRERELIACSYRTRDGLVVSMRQTDRDDPLYYLSDVRSLAAKTRPYAPRSLTNDKLVS